MKCPHCLKPLIIRAYFERYEDSEATVVDGYLDLGEVVGSDVSYDVDPTDFECAACKNNLTDIISVGIEDLKKSHPAMFA